MDQTALTLDGARQALTALADAFEARYGDEGLPASVFQADPDRAPTRDEDAHWRFSVYVTTAEADAWNERLAAMAREQGLPDDVERTDFGRNDWVAETLRALAPVRAGRFLVHGSHDRGAVRAGDVAVEIDAGLAFGTGHHGTTAGCLRMLDLALRGRRPRRAMDIGAGSGVLAIALARAARIPVLASDIDPVAEIVARANARTNGVASFVTCVTAAGFHSPAFDAFGRADLLLANILAGPLRRLAQPMRRHLAPGATVILSGLLPHQRPGIVAFYSQQRIRLERAHVENGWLTLVMRSEG